MLMLMSKIQFQPKLNVARQVIANQPPVSSAVHIRVDRVEVDVVEGIEKLGTKLKIEAFVDLDISDPGNIPVERTWAKKHAGPGSSKVTNGVSKRFGIEELGNRARAGAGDARNDVGPGHNIGEVNSNTTWIGSSGAGEVFRPKRIIELAKAQ